MYPSAALCRAQEALQLDRAITAQLPNVRTIARRAAAAWAIEAISADKRERRKEKTRLASASLAGEKQAPLRENDLSFSENPDRGLASTGSRSPPRPLDR